MKRACFVLLMSIVSFLLIRGPACAGVEIPERLKGIPLIQGSVIIQATDKPNICSATMEARADVETVADFYKQTLEKSGWKMVSHSQTRNGASLEMTKGKENFHVTIVGKKKGAKLVYTLAHKTPK